MSVREWRRPARLLVVFLVVAGVSLASLLWLGWQLLEQDRALEAQRRQEALEQTADRAAGSIVQEILDLRARLRSPGEAGGALPPAMTLVAIGRATVAVRGGAGLPYLPVRSDMIRSDPEIFADGERLEFSGQEPAAARGYARLARSSDRAVRAGALARLARVLRKRRDLGSALSAYDALTRIDGVDVGGLPASLVARVGRASALEEAGRRRDLHDEAEALRHEISDGRWPLLASEYDYYLSRVDEWLGSPAGHDLDAQSRAEAVDWLWRQRASLGPAGHRGLVLPGGPALVAWEADGDGLAAVVGGPAYVSGLCGGRGCEAQRWALSDAEGRLVVGVRPPSGRVAVRPASAGGLPWTLTVTAGDADIPPSPRRRLLIAVLALVGMVLAAGWYFILRAISHEVRLARLQSDFVAAVSHEFRSPLTSIAHVSEMLSSGRLPPGDLQKRSFDVLVRDTDRLRRLVEELLDLARFEAGRATLQLEPLDVGSLVRATVADFREQAIDREVSVVLDLPPVEIEAPVDRETLARAVWNLLDNAVKYSPDGSTVWVEVGEREGHVRIAVRDRGMGIPAAERRDIFHRFVRGAESKAKRIRGTGVGLALVKEIVEAHGGEIGLESELGQGSTFTIVLKAAAPCPPSRPDPGAGAERTVSHSPPSDAGDLVQQRVK